MPELDAKLEPVTRETDCERLADIDRDAYQDDSLWEWYQRYTPDEPWQDCLDELKKEIRDPRFEVIKASMPSGPGSDETIVGFIHFMHGFIQMGKVDPFAEFEHGRRQMREAGLEVQFPNARSEGGETQAGFRSSSATGGDQPYPSSSDAQDIRSWRLSRGTLRYDHSRQFYVRAIRGKKHIYIKRIMVDPRYQRCGIGARLLEYATDLADEEKICCWLFSRPAGEKLYMRMGFEILGRTEMAEPDDGFECGSCAAMLREPSHQRSS